MWVMYPAQGAKKPSRGPLQCAGAGVPALGNPPSPRCGLPGQAAATNTQVARRLTVPGTTLITPHACLPLLSLSSPQAHLPGAGTQVQRRQDTDPHVGLCK